MHGFVFHKLQEFFLSRADGKSWAAVVANINQRPRAFHVGMIYPDEVFVSLFQSMAAQLNLDPYQAMVAFGRFMAKTLVETGGLLGLIQPGWKTLDVIENTKHLIHSALHSYNPQLQPPDIRCVRLRSNEVAIAYQSPRKLCGVVKGIVMGLADYFGEQVDIHENICMLKKGRLCRINVRLLGVHGESEVGANHEIKEILNHGGDLKLFNLYKGVPISYPALLLKYSENAILIKAPRTQLVAAQAEGVTFMSSPWVDIGLRGRVKGINWQTMSLTLSHIVYAEGQVGQRAAVRIEPGEEVSVIIRSAEQTLTTRLLDISMSGISVESPSSHFFKEDELYQNLELELSLAVKNWDPFLGDLEQRQVELKPTGELLGISSKADRQIMRLVFSDISTKDLATMEQYIMQIQLEVLRDLRERIQ
ncbi:MAG: heme NO-binding domain-containing protein [Magnetococcales bacterium]|nr:heme NO-binding domain-containing protein [Magnetococcales bacterium]